MIHKPIATLTLVIILAPGFAAAADEQASQPADITAWSQKNFVHPPLKCMEPYKRIDEYPVVAWCFHGMGVRGHMPYDEDYARAAKACGFNVLIDAAAMLEPCRKVGGIKVVVPAFWAPPEKLKAYIFNPHGDHPALLGIVLDDNCSAIHRQVVENGKWIIENYPHVMPWISENPNPQAQSKTPIRVMGTQNYPFLRGARGSRAERAYCDRCNYDRWFGNANNMSVWQIFGGHNAFNQIRYQMMAALAYGAQGLVNFAYTPHRTEIYKPGNEMIPKFHEMHTYISRVIGRHLWGTRCIEVIHSVHGGAHKNALRPRSDRPVVNTSAYVMVGLLTPEAKFYSKDPADRAVPEYLMVVDKRTGGGEGSPIDMFLMLHAKIPAVELLDAEALPDAKIRKIIPGWKIRRRTSHGDGLLLRVSPDLEKLLGGKDGLKLYDEINRTMAELQWKINPPPVPNEDEKKGDVQPEPTRVTAEEAARTFAAVKGKLASLETALGAAVRAGAISQAQAADAIQRLRSAIEATVGEAQAPAE